MNKIPLNFGLWWSGSKLSYLRYLTFKSLRHFHPDAKISLYVSDNFKKDGHKWNVEKQDFEQENDFKNYMSELKDLDVEIINCDKFDNYQPNFQSDLFRWWFLKENGGFYLDTDQIIVQSFDNLPLNSDFIYSAYLAQSCGYYTPVGVIGASKDSQMVSTIHELLPQFIDPSNYNSAGPFMFRRMLGYQRWLDLMAHVPFYYFYPVPESQFVSCIYDGSFEVKDKSFALHWYGGNPLSQEFNNKYTEEFSKKSNDSISVFLRNKKII